LSPISDSDEATRVTGVSDNSATIVQPSSGASYSVAYAYDAMNRPINATWPNVPGQTAPAAFSASFSFTYDANNRRINGNHPAAAPPVSYTANNLNQYTAGGSASPTYDGNGNLTYDGHFTYCYDTESRLTSVWPAADFVDRQLS
jgi:hypothetical protein